MSTLDIELGFASLHSMAPYWALFVVSMASIALAFMGWRWANLQWTLGHGYIDLWATVHRLEEALLMVRPVESAVAESMQIEERLYGSPVPQANSWIFRAQQARAVLVGAVPLNSIWNLPVPGRPTGPEVPNPAPAAVDQIQAREWLRSARYAINSFRDDNWRGLIRARNNLYSSIFMVNLFGLLITIYCVAVKDLARLETTHVIAAVSFYFAGAMTGLFSQLALDSESNTAVEDYGLAWARRVNTPVLSGMAGLGAALLIPMLSAVALMESPGNGPDVAIPTLGQLLDLKDHTMGIVLAAIFGASPAVLIKRLQTESEKYKTAISQSSSINGPST